MVNSSDADFAEQLTAALNATGATLAFDAIGGGKLGNAILMAMEAAAVQRMTEWSRMVRMNLSNCTFTVRSILHLPRSTEAMASHGVLAAGF